MKKLIFLLCMMAGILSAHAQFSTTMPLTAGDTVVNTGTASKIISFTGGYAGAVIEVKVTKISGTGAGTVKLFGNNDNGTYTTQIGSTYTITDVATQEPTFFVTSPLPQYIKVLATGSGTESVVITVIYRLPFYQPK